MQMGKENLFFLQSLLYQNPIQNLRLLKVSLKAVLIIPKKLKISVFTETAV